MDAEEEERDLCLYLLGRFELRAHGRIVVGETWPRRKAKAVLKLLALESARSLHREQLLEALWPESAYAAALNNLHVNLHHLRGPLAQHGVPAPLLHLNGDMVSLDCSLWVDIDDFRGRAERARSARTDVTLYREALAAYHGDLLPEDLYEEWTEPDRAELRGLSHLLILELSRNLELRGQSEEAIAWLERLVREDALREEAHRSLMRLYAQAGIRERAFQQYRRCRELLRDELGVEPAEETEALYAEIREGRIGGLDRSTCYPVLDGPFVGREQEQARVRAAVEGAIAGQARFQTVVGEPGIGKTRLADELARYARVRNAQVLWGRSFEASGTPAYWPWIEIVRSYARGRDRRTLLSDLGAGASYIAELVPEVRERFLDLEAAPVPEPEAQFRLFDAMAAFLRRVGDRRPLLLILDDLHWADKPSLQLLEFLVRDLRDARLLIVGTYREEELDQGHPLSEALGELHRERPGHNIVLHGLSDEEVGRFVHLTTGRAPSEALVAVLQERAGGNPLYLGESVRAAADVRCLANEPWSVLLPQSVRDVIRRRLQRLPEACRDLLQIAAVIGRDFGLSVLERVKELPAERVADLLEEALTARILTPQDGAPGRYAFSHVLTRESLYSDLPLTDRSELHWRVGEALEELYGRDVEPHLAELAHHYLHALPAGDVDKAVAYAQRAGDRAVKRAAYEEAASYFRRSLEAMELQSQPDEVERVKLLVALAEAVHNVGCRDEASQIALRAADLARDLGATELFAHAVWRYETLPRRVGASDPKLIGLLQEALTILGDANRPIKARIMGALATRLTCVAGERARVEALCDEAVASARRLGDKGALASVLIDRDDCLQGRADAVARLPAVDESLRLAELCADRPLVWENHARRFSIFLELGRIAAADAEWDVVISTATSARRPGEEWRIAVLSAMRAILEGRFHEAENFAVQALALGQKAQDPDAPGIYALQLFTLRREQGRLRELESAVRRLVSEYPEMESWRAGLAVLYLELGEEAKVGAIFDELAAKGFRDIPEDANRLSVLASLAEVCAHLKDTRRALVLYNLLSPYAHRNIVPRSGVLCFGSTSRYLGLLAGSLSRWEKAVSHFDCALEMNATIRARPHIAWTQHEYARLLLASGQGRAPYTAQALLEQAAATAHELSMASLCQVIRTDGPT